MKFFVVLFAVIAAAFAAPQFGGFSGSAANANAASQSFGGGLGGFGLSGSSANAAASSQSFNQGGGGYYPQHGGHYPQQGYGHHGGGGYGHNPYGGGFGK